VKWVWIDCFSKLLIDQNKYQILKDIGFNLCIVSPELQGREQDIKDYARFLEENKIFPDAICTKFHNISKWNDSIPVFISDSLIL
jgi:hypothetical protein